MKAKSLAPKQEQFVMDPRRIDLVVATLGGMVATMTHLRDSMDTESDWYRQGVSVGKKPVISGSMVNALCIDGATDMLYIAGAFAQLYTWSDDDAKSIRREEDTRLVFRGLAEKVAMEREILLRKIKHQVKR